MLYKTKYKPVEKRRTQKYFRVDDNLYTDINTLKQQSKRRTSQKEQKPARMTASSLRFGKKRKLNKYVSVTLLVVIFVFLFRIFLYSFHNYIADIHIKHSKTVLKANFYKLMFPTHSYLYKDLFLGKYTIKDTDYKKLKMKDMVEGVEKRDLKYELLSLASQYPTIKPAVYLWEYGNGSYVDIDADEVYPAASIIKIPVLIEMFREIDAGKFSLNDSMVLEDYYRAGGSGKLKRVAGRIPYSLDYLAEVMIENSDNSATNMIMAKAGGMPEINRAMRMWGLKTTRINSWLPDLEGTNVTTAREMAKMLYNLDVTDIVKKESKQRAGYYLSHVKNNRLLHAGLPEKAVLLHKTGDIGFMLGDAGIVKTLSGKKYLVVIMVRRPYNSPKGKEFIVNASRIIYNNIERI